MFDDGRTVGHGKQLECDICILGGGAAGITLAREFNRTKKSVILLESGGLDPEPETQALYKGENDGIFYSLTLTRLRYLGGSTNHWTGMCRPFTAAEFNARSWIPDSGWPINTDDLAQYYPVAQRLCELGPYHYETSYWQKKGLHVLDLAGSGLHSQVYQLGPPTRFGKVYRAELQQSKNITVLLHANATELVPTNNGKMIQHVRVQCLNGNAFSVRARTFVLAMGGIENARLLLASNSVISTGIGNEHDNVGRYFMDHIRSFGVASIQAKKDSVDRSYFEIATHTGTRTTSVLRIDPATEEKLGIAGFYTGFYRVRKSNAAYSYRTLREALAKGKRPDDFYRHLDNVLSDPDAVREERKRMEAEKQGFTEPYTTIDLIEQVPDRASRISLSDQKDRLNMPTTRMHWKFGDIETRTLYQSHKLLRTALNRINVGKLESSMQTPTSDWPKRVEGSAHHMGSTRMHTDPQRGVVDRNCQVFGTRNLFVAGSSVFTCSGTTNPTLTIVALTLRLADFLKQSGG